MERNQDCQISQNKRCKISDLNMNMNYKRGTHQYRKFIEFEKNSKSGTESTQAFIVLLYDEMCEKAYRNSTQNMDMNYKFLSNPNNT